ncbi:MAG: RnfH family protein [Proteobacteria bacterium]|nr:MAG: RnfH family protein [Pseudomonadota bacterium]
MEPGEGVAISVVYALPEHQAVVPLTVPPGTTVAAAVELSGLPRRFPDIHSRPLACAIYGRVVALSQCVAPGDRIEILRPLTVDPKEARRRRVG